VRSILTRVILGMAGGREHELLAGLEGDSVQEGGLGCEGEDFRQGRRRRKLEEAL